MQCYASPGLCPVGIYDTLLWDGDKICNRNQHLERFINNCHSAGMNSVYDTEPTDELLRKLINTNNINALRCRIRIMAFHSVQHKVDGDGFNLLMAVWKIDNSVKSGPHFRCAVSERRRSSNDKHFQLKRLGMEFIDTDLIAAHNQGFSDILYLNDREEFCEASYSNLWVYNGRTLLTPPVDSPCLPGIVRARILSHAKKDDIPVCDGHPIDLKCVSDAREIFLSSSIRRIQPVTEIPSLRWQANPDKDSVVEKLLRIIVP